MTDIERVPASRPVEGTSPSPADRRANLGEYLLAMSHEIRAPLNTVIGMSGMLVDSDLGEPSHRYAKEVHSAGESLAAILNDLLDLSRVTAGRLAVDPIAFDLRSTIEETASALTSRAKDRGLSLRVDWRPELPRHVVGDPGRTRQVLGNLIGHAISTTSHGEVVIRILLDGERGGIPAVRFVVEDTGIGIMPERLARIFDDYLPVDASTYRSFGVTGLGLRLSADLVRRMGGEIGAESVAGKGSRFWFVLPMASAEPRAVPGVHDGKSAGGRALVVEVDLAARGRYIEQIEAAGWAFHFVNDLGQVPGTLREAAAEGDPFDACFISDYAVRPLHMEVAVKIKAESPIAETALVMVTAVGSPGEGKKLWHAGFAAYLRKPVPNEEMGDALGALTNLGPDGRGSSLITRHSLAEARNAQVFAPDGIDEMLASLTPFADPTDDGETGEAPAAEVPAPDAASANGPAATLPPRIETTTWYVPVFAAGPQREPPAPAVQAEEVPTPAVAVLEAPVEQPVGQEPGGEATISKGLISFEAIKTEAVAEAPLDRPETFDSTGLAVAPAEGLERVVSGFDTPNPQVDGLLGHDFGAPASETPAIVEPIDYLPPGEAIAPDELRVDPEELPSEAGEIEEEQFEELPSEELPSEADEPWIDMVEDVEALEPALEQPIELTLDDTAELPVTAAAIEIEIATPEPPAEPAVAAAAPEGNQNPAPEPSELPKLDVVSPQILDQLASGGGFFTHYLVMTFVRELPGTIAELATATNRGDGTKIKAALGTLRTIGGLVGSGRISATCDRLEAAVDRGQLDEAAPLIGTIEQGFVEARDALDAAGTTGLPADIPAVGGAFLEQLGPGRDGPAKGLAIRLIDSFSNDASARISELREVVARGDAEQAQRIAQTVKGMCGLVSAEPLAKLCALVEADARLKRIGQADRYLDHLDREFERVRGVLATARG